MSKHAIRFHGSKYFQAMTKKSINIIIVDDDPFVRQGMKKLIEKEFEFNVILSTESAKEALSFINEAHPDFVIIGIALESEESGLSFIKSLSAEFPEVKILVLSIHDNNVFAERVFLAGAHGYITKDVAPSAIIESIHTVMAGKPYLYGGNTEENS